MTAPTRSEERARRFTVPLVAGFSQSVVDWPEFEKSLAREIDAAVEEADHIATERAIEALRIKRVTVAQHERYAAAIREAAIRAEGEGE